MGYTMSARPRVLVVDDDEPTAYAVDRALATAGCDVTSVTRVANALDALERQPFDVLLTDIKMPGQPHGFAVAKMARVRQSLRGIFFMTAYPDLAQLAEEDQTVFMKPLDLGMIAAAIHLACDKPPPPP